MAIFTRPIDGRKHASSIRRYLADRVAQRKSSMLPSLVTIVVGDNPASHTYVRFKTKAAKSIGMQTRAIVLHDDTSEHELIRRILELNEDSSVNGILVQLPLPSHHQVRKVVSAIDPLKDVDGFHPNNVAALVMGDQGFIPCTPLGCLYLLYAEGIKVSGAHCVVIGRSAVVGRPMAHLLLREHATVTSCHRFTKNLADVTRSADILISATGVAGLLTKDHVSPGATVIDVGQGRNGKGVLVGDACHDALMGHAGALTPVPGGVGPMTIAMLLTNTMAAYARQNPDEEFSIRDMFQNALALSSEHNWNQILPVD